jgi:hypothetical protein
VRSTMRGHLFRWPAIVMAGVVSCLLSGCQLGVATSAAVVSPSMLPAPSPVAVQSPIPVAVAPVAVAPGATRAGVVVPSMGAAPAVVPSLPRTTYTAPCRPYSSPKQIALQVSPGSAAATITWTSDGDASVSSYRVSAVSQHLVAGTQPPYPTTTIARGPGCRAVSVTLSGLRHGTPYVFWLEEASVDLSTRALVYTLVGQSGGVLVP